MTVPQFSIIVPTFCVEHVIMDCLASLRRQTCVDFEIIIMDGGSTDRTLELINQFAADFGERLVVRSEKDAGVYDAMNKAIRLARGEWLYFLGADDHLHAPEVLQTVADFLRQHPESDLVYGDVLLRSNACRYAGEFNLHRLLHEKNICHQAIFYRRTIFEKIGRYNLQYRIWADWDLNIRCFHHPESVVCYLDLVIADYNDLGGISRVEDPEFRKLLPLFTKKDAKIRDILRQKIRNLFRLTV